MPAFLHNQEGIALIIALMLTLMLTVIGIGIITSSSDEVNIAGNELNEMKAFYAAEAGLDKATAIIQTHYEATGVPPASFPAETLNIGGVTYGYSVIPEATSQRKLTKGSLGGLNAFIRPYTIQSSAVDSSHSTAFTLEQSFEVAFVPLFQFSVFYENDLEIAPGPSMLLLGRIHSNGDLYLQANNSLQIESYLTAHGDIYHGRKPGSGLGTSEGDVLIKSLDGNYHSMKDGGDWLDANDAHWFDTASVRWGGRVQDAAFGQEKLNLPLTGSSDSAHKLIERYDAGANPDSYENKAALKIIDGQAYYDAGGSWVNVTGSLTASGILSETSFYDAREGSDVTVTDIDVAALNASAYAPSGGIVYISDHRSGLRGARLNDAEDLGFPMTIASENPVYTVGDINTIDKQPMAIMADALTVLSDNWSDDPALAANLDKTVRAANSVEANLCYITGNRETGAGGSAYNGGLENLPRFLEDWGGVDFKFRGSIVNLWYSQMATGDWSGSYYTPPNRDWAFDPDLNDPANMPPGTPMVRSFIRWGWHQIDVGFDPEDFAAAAVDGA